MRQVTRHIPSRPFVLIVLSIIGIMIWNSYNKSSAISQHTVKMMDFVLKVFYMFKDVPHSYHIKRIVGNSGDVFGSKYLFIKAFRSNFTGMFIRFQGRNVAVVDLGFMQKITRSATDIQNTETCFSQSGYLQFSIEIDGFYNLIKARNEARIVFLMA